MREAYTDYRNYDTGYLKRLYHQDALSLEPSKGRRWRLEKIRQELKRRGLKLKISRRPPWTV